MGFVISLGSMLRFFGVCIECLWMVPHVPTIMVIRGVSLHPFVLSMKNLHCDIHVSSREYEANGCGHCWDHLVLIVRVTV